MAKGHSAEDRARQAEIDAARAREMEEEREFRREQRGAEALARLNAGLMPVVTARVVREYVRGVMIEPVIRRIYDIGMGVETFDVPTMAGNTVNVPASPSVQVKALAALAAIGVPTQLGLVDDDGNVLPGVIALGELDLRSAQHEVHAGRLAGAARALSGEEGIDTRTERSETSPLSPDIARRVERGEFEVVEVTEGGPDARVSVDAAPPPLTEGHMTPEQRILAKRRARRQGAGNGNGS